MRTPWHYLVCLLALVLVMPAAALADGGGGGGGAATQEPPKDPSYTSGLKAIEDGTGLPTRRGATAIRQSRLGYEKALALDPRHLGAHEYIGEAYLALDDLAKAKEHLARLDRCVCSAASSIVTSRRRSKPMSRVMAR